MREMKGKYLGFSGWKGWTRSDLTSLANCRTGGTNSSNAQAGATRSCGPLNQNTGIFSTG